MSQLYEYDTFLLPIEQYDQLAFTLTLRAKDGWRCICQIVIGQRILVTLERQVDGLEG